MGYLIIYGYLFGCFVILSLIRYYTNLKIEYTRKIMHFLTGLTWFMIVKYYYQKIDMIIIPISFVFINIFSYKFKIFKIIERKEKNHFGTIYYAIGFLSLAILNYFNCNFLNASNIAVIILTFGDGAASFFGGMFKNIILFHDKTLVGFLSFIIFSFLGCLLYSIFFKVNIKLEKQTILIITAAVLELLTGGGLDNLSILFGITSIGVLII